MHQTFYKEGKKKKPPKQSQKELFMEIWNERLHECIECGKYLNTPKPHNFDHIKTKGSRRDLKYDKDNIQILCFKCHFYKHNHLNYCGPDLD